MINRFEAARKFAKNIIEKEHLTPPIYPEKIINSLNIELVEEENQLGIEAYSNLGLIPKITINTNFTFPARRRFTLAHELGHVIIPWHNGDVKCDTDKPYMLIGGQRMLDTQELEANIFASELLMPENWLKEQIGNEPIILENLLALIQQKAQTSIMACLYALENTLPSGHVYFVKKEYTDYYKKFSSPNTITIDLFGDNYDTINLLENICDSKEHFKISQYDILHFCVWAFHDEETIKNIYNLSKDITNLINTITNYEPKKILLSLKHVLNTIDDIYTAIVFHNGSMIKKVSHYNSKIKIIGDNINDLISTFEQNHLKYYILNDSDIQILFIYQNNIEIPKINYKEPNELLKEITINLYPENHHRMLQSINGIVANINSSYTNADATELYNIIKYRFAGDSKFVELYNHTDFDTYIVNKTFSMIKNRKH